MTTFWEAREHGINTHRVFDGIWVDGQSGTTGTSIGDAVAELNH